jgi:tRNA(fMet)-specific endonuclease VapC
MSLYVLDTDMLTLVAEGHPAVSRRFLQQRPEDVAITVLTVEEQLSGWYTELRKAKRPERLARTYRRLADTVRFLSRLQILTYNESAMQRFEELRKQKIRIGGRNRYPQIPWKNNHPVGGLDALIRWRGGCHLLGKCLNLRHFCV